MGLLQGDSQLQARKGNGWKSYSAQTRVHEHTHTHTQTCQQPSSTDFKSHMSGGLWLFGSHTRTKSLTLPL